MCLARWQIPYILGFVTWQRTFYVTSETGFDFKGQAYFCRTGFCSRQEARCMSVFLRVLSSVCLSVSDTPLCASHILLSRMLVHTCVRGPPTTSNRPPSFSDTSRGLCEHHLPLSHEWFYLFGQKHFIDVRKSNLYKSVFLFIDVYEQDWC